MVELNMSGPLGSRTPHQYRSTIMRIPTRNVLPGDIVRGIGLVIDYSEPHSDFFWMLQGHTTKFVDGEVVTEAVEVKISLPNDHVVNVRRADENFHADRVVAAGDVLSLIGDDGSFDSVVNGLTRVANMPRHRWVSREAVEAYVRDEFDDERDTPAEVVDALDAILEPEVAEPVPFI